MELPFRVLHGDARLPAAAHEHDAGLDLRSVAGVRARRPASGRWCRSGWRSRSRPGTPAW